MLWFGRERNFLNITNSRTEPAHVKEALSLFDRVHLSTIQNEWDRSLQHVTEGIINMVEDNTIHSKKQTVFFHC